MMQVLQAERLPNSGLRVYRQAIIEMAHFGGQDNETWPCREAATAHNRVVITISFEAAKPQNPCSRRMLNIGSFIAAIPNSLMNTRKDGMRIQGMQII